MPISPRLLRKLQEVLGAEAAEDLVSRMADIDATRGDIAELRHEMQLGFARIDGRFDAFEARIDGRFKESEARTDGRFKESEARIDARFEKLGALLEKGLREQTRFFFLAWSVLLAAIVGLYAR